MFWTISVKAHHLRSGPFSIYSNPPLSPNKYVPSLKTVENVPVKTVY